MQRKDKNDSVTNSTVRWEKYQESIKRVRNECPREVFFEAGDGGQDIEQVNKPNHSSNRVYSEKGSSPSLRSQVGGHARGSAIIQINSPKHSNDRVYSEEGISPTLNTMQGGRRQPFVARKYNKTIRVGGQKSPHGSKQNWDSYEIDTRIRRLTPTETMRLMSWPDDWCDNGNFDGEVKEISDTQKYKMAGNGVVSNCVEAIVRELIL